jgi:two-component system, LytTR family, response regulator
MRVVIVDDEPLARQGVALRLQNEPDVEVVGEYGDGTSAVAGILEMRPDLVLLDIQMAGGMNGFDLLRNVPRHRLPYIIFVTAYEEHALRAFEVHAVDYLLKPIDDERFAEAIERVRCLRQSGSITGAVERISDLLNQQGIQSKYTTHFPVRTGSRIQVVSVADIEWIGAAGDYVELHCGSVTRLMRSSMGAIELQLDPKLFMRIHRSRIVRLAAIRELRPIDNREYVIKLMDGTEHRSSRLFADRFERWLEQH